MHIYVRDGPPAQHYSRALQCWRPELVQSTWMEAGTTLGLGVKSHLQWWGLHSRKCNRWVSFCNPSACQVVSKSK